jgi:hypothetical protein
VWVDEDQSKLGWKLLLKRSIGIVLFLVLAHFCKEGALNTARWPEPIKYIGIVLIFIAAVLFVWGIIILWRVLRQLRLRRLLIALGLVFVIVIVVSALTSDSPLPLHEQIWVTTKQLVASVGRRTRDIAVALIEIPREFRFAYTGRRRPILLPGMDPDDPSYLTPIPANRPAQFAPDVAPTPMPTRTSTVTQEAVPSAESTPKKAVVPSPTSTAVGAASTKAQSTTPTLAPPDCPQAQARLTVPRVNEVIDDEIQVEGSAHIENLAYYKFEFKREDVEDEWHWAASFEKPVEEGVLGIWPVSHLPEGIYTFRLTVVNEKGNYPFQPCEVQVQIRH